MEQRTVPYDGGPRGRERPPSSTSSVLPKRGRDARGSHTVHTGRTVRSPWPANLCVVTRPASQPFEELTPQERVVYTVLNESAGRVVSRAEIARRAGIADLSERRCDSLIVGIRRRLGPDRVRTVRRRGWMLVA